MHCENIRINDYRQNGNYSFQYARNVEISNAVIHSKDAFWQTENVTVRDSELHGEYLGWHSKHLHLINCHISGTASMLLLRLDFGELYIRCRLRPCLRGVGCEGRSEVAYYQRQESYHRLYQGSLDWRNHNRRQYPCTGRLQNRNR